VTGLGVPAVPDPRDRWVLAPWRRAILYVLAVLVASFLVALLAALVLGELAARGAIAKDFGDTPAGRLILTVLTSLAILGVTGYFLRRIEGVRWSSLLPRTGAWRELLLGALAGALLLAALDAWLLLAGWLRVVGWSETASRGALAPALWGLAQLLVFALQGGAEEIFCRGYLQRALCQWRGAIVGLVITSPLFGVLHGLNPGASGIAILNTSLVGLLLGLVVIRLSLWAAIALHAVWNFLLAFALSQPVSGFTMPGLAATSITGSRAATGGDFGPEASLPLTALVLAGIALALLWPGRAQAFARLRERYDAGSSSPRES
jgi:membrane protease YdiL (CAAX protease family)